MIKSWDEINYKINRGKAVVLTAAEIKTMAESKSCRRIAEEVDVVTTGTFGAMCSSGAFLNFGHPSPAIKMEEIFLNDVPAYGGLAAVDTYLGATAVSRKKEDYGGGHVLVELIQGKDVRLKARGRGTDCYPRKAISTYINLQNINEAILFNPRNSYQNYAAAVNSSPQTLYTYMGTLLGSMGNITYSSAGEISPLINCPDFSVIGLGSRIFLAGAQGFITGAGTQFNSEQNKNSHNIPVGPGGTLAVMGNMKEMSAEFIKPAYYQNYGISLMVGIGIPIPILNEDIARAVLVRNQDIQTKIIDFGNNKKNLGIVSYDELRSGKVRLGNKIIKTAPLSSLSKAMSVAKNLQRWIQKGEFLLQKPLAPMPRQSVKALEIRNPNKTAGKDVMKKLPVDNLPHIEWRECVHCGACTAPCSAGALTVLPPLYHLAFAAEKCKGCRLCQKACPLRLISFRENNHQ